MQAQADIKRGAASGAVMDQFNYLFSFFGLIIGLAVADVAGSCAAVVAGRRSIRVGTLTPMLAGFVLLDIASFWFQAWNIRAEARVEYTSLFFTLAVAMAYYLSVALLFPKPIVEGIDLDDNYWANKRYIVAGVAFANLAIYAVIAYFDPEIRATIGSWQDWMYYGPLAALMVSRWPWVDRLALAVAIGMYVAGSMLGAFDL